MRLAELTPEETRRALRDEGLHLVTGAFTVHVHTRLAALAGMLREMYGEYAVARDGCIDDVRVRVDAIQTPRTGFRSRVASWIDGRPTFGPSPLTFAYLAFESSVNWGIALSDVAPLLMHAAVVERDGRAVLLPGASGSGKSTLCAALVCSGWRLFSDEMGIFGFDDHALRANPRAVSLKNSSIDVIGELFPEAHLTERITDTPKGTIAYMRAPASSVARADEGARPALVVRPIYREGAGLALRRLPHLEAFRLLSDNTVNYASMLEHGFDVVTDIVERCPVFELTYSDTHAAVAAVGRLHAGDLDVSRAP